MDTSSYKDKVFQMHSAREQHFNTLLNKQKSVKLRYAEVIQTLGKSPIVSSKDIIMSNAICKNLKAELESVHKQCEVAAKELSEATERMKELEEDDSE